MYEIALFWKRTIKGITIGSVKGWLFIVLKMTLYKLDLI